MSFKTINIKAYEEAKAKYNIKTPVVDKEYIKKYVEDCQNYSQTAQTDYENLGYNNSKSSYSKHLRISNSLSYRTDIISNYLKANKDKFDTKTYNEFMSFLDNGKKYLTTVPQSFANAKKYYSQWETAEEYNKHIKNQEELLSFDLEKGRSDIALLDREIEEIKKNIKVAESYYDSLSKNHSGAGVNYGPNNGTPGGQSAPYNPKLDELSKQISDYQVQLSSRQKERNQKEAYYNQAKKLQENKSLTENAVNASDFETYSAKGENNKITQLRNEFSNDDSIREDLTLTRQSRFAKYLSDDELDVYEYYIGKGDTTSAEAYLNSLEDTVNARKGSEIFEFVEDKPALELAFGFAAGLEQFSVGLGNLFTDKDYYSATAIQQASGLIREDLADEGFKIGDISIAQGAYDFITTTSNMLPSILTSALVTYGANKMVPGAGNYFGEAVGSLLLGASASGNAYAEMINLGYNKNQARTYSVMVGASEAGLQFIMGGINNLGGVATKGLTTKFVSSLDNALAKGAIKFGDTFANVMKGTVKYGSKMLSEGVEEYMQEILDPLFKNIAFNERNKISLYTPEALYSGVLGALSAGVLDAPFYIRSTAKTYSRGKTAIESGVEFERLKELGQTFSADSVAYKIADRIDENTGAYTIGKFLNEAGAELTQQNQDDIANALIEKGVTEVHAKSISKWLARTVDGVKLNRAQKHVLEENEVVSEVFRDVIINKNSTINQRRQNFFETAKLKGYTGTDIEQVTRTEEEVISDYNQKLALNEEMTRNILNQSNTAQRLRNVSGFSSDSDILAFANEVANNGESQTNSVAQANQKTIKILEPQEHDVSAEGKTILNTPNGAEDVEIKGVALTKGKNMTLELSDGRKVSSKDIEYSSKDEAIVYETVANMEVPTEVANKLLKNYSPGQPGGVYAFGVKEAYQYGYYNYSMAELMTRASFAPELTANQRETAYDLGKAMSKADFKTNKGKKSYSKGKVIFDGDKSQLTPRQKTSLDTLEKIAELTGLQIKVFESDVVGGIHIGKNGSFRVGTSEMEIDLHSGSAGQGIMLHTASHELVHYIRQWSAEKYKILADFLMEQYGKKGVSVDTLVRRQIEKAKKAGRTLSYAEAHEEVIADSMETMLNDGRVIEKLQMLQAKDKTLFEKIKSFISELVERIKKAYKNVKPETSEGQIVASMLDEIETIQQLFVDAIADASENFRNAEVDASKSTSQRNEVKYSISTDKQGSYVKVDVNQDVFDGKNTREMQEIARKLIKENFKGKVLSVGADGKAYINKRSAEEYAYPANRRMDDTIKEAKMRSSVELDNLLAISEFVENQPDDGRHPQATGGWDVYTTRFEVASKMFIGEVKIMATDRGYVFYDITKIKRLPVNGGQTETGSVAASGNLSKNIISNSDGNVNTSISEKGVKYSDRYSELHTMNVRINELREQRKAIMASEEYNKAVEETVRSDDIDKAIKAYVAFIEKSGLKKVDKEITDLEKKAGELRDLLNKETELELSTERETAIAESGLTEAEYDRKQAIKEFGYTPYYYDAGYILDNGKMLNFSGEKGKHFGTRGEDHRGISRIFNGTLEGTASMVKFMNEGNIRIMDETPGLDISIMPTKEQFGAIKKYINSKKGEIAVDISDADGRNISSVFYNKGTSADWIILDIKEYFEKGKIPEQEDVKYSDRDTAYMTAVKNGDEATQRRLLDEKAVEWGAETDSNGKPRVLYHGTESFGFTKIKTSKSDDGISFFATDALDVAGSYAQTMVSDSRRINDSKEKLTKKAVPKLRNQLKVTTLEFLHEYTEALGVYDDWYMNSIEYITNRDMSEIVSPEELIEFAKSVVRDISATHSNIIEAIESPKKNKRQERLPSISEETKQRLSEIVNEYATKASDVIAPYGNSGVYSMYARTDNHLVIDAHGSLWSEIKSDDLPSKEGAWTTRDVARYAKDNGYDGVTFKNLIDAANHTALHPATVYIFFDPQSQVKSADLVTHNSFGKPIPLSKRFDSSKSDIRYSDRNYLEAVESGDMTTAQRMVDEAAKAAGYAYKLYHQTGNDFTVFDTRHHGAGTGDSETPFGVFMKPTSNNIGLRGQKQMAVFAKIEKPLIAADRESLMYEFKKDESVKKIQDKIKMTNDNYKRKVEQAGKDLQSYLIEYRKSHPNEPRSEIYNDEGFNEIYDREDSLIEEWTSEIDKLSIDSKNAINDYLENNGYDGVIIERDVGSFGRETKTYIALDNTQVKSAETITYDDNGNVIPLSERFDNEQSDIRYSQRGKSLESKNSLWYDKHNPLSFDNRAGVNPRSSINWVYKAEIFSQVENKLFHQMISEINQGSEAFEKNSAGEYMLPIENKIVFTDGNYDYPYIREIVEVMTDAATEFEDAKERIFNVEKGKSRKQESARFLQNFYGDGFIVSYRNGVVGVYAWENGKRKGRTRREVIGNYQRKQNGRGNDREINETSLKPSDRDPDALTPRNLLANALEESAVHEVEKKKLAEYKANIEKLYANEQELYEVRKEIKELSFAPGKRDTAKLKTLREKSIELSNAVTFYDKKLLNLESTSFLKNVLEREKKKAIKRQKEKDAEHLKAQKEKALQKEKEITERYQASRKKAVESRNRTVMRNKIKRVVNELNQYLLNGNKDKHVMDNMKKVVAEALNVIDMDTVGADERVEKYNQLISEATDPDVIASLTETRDRIQSQGDNLNEKLMSLKNAYADIINSTDPVIANAYDKVIEDKILSVAQSIEDTSIRNMSLKQLEDVYDLYKMVLTNIRNSNKAFKLSKDETISELGYKVNSEVENVTTQKYKVSAFKDYISKFGWNELKPIYAFRMIGSETFQRLFNNILRGQDTWYRDVDEGRTFQQNAKKKYGYSKWDFKKNYTFKAKNGKNFDLTLQQIMSLYAFSRREQALEHLVQGGIVLDSDIKVVEKVKGIPVRYKVNTTDAFNLSPEIIGEIIDSLTAEQKAFVEEMQSFLSDVMGEKGNEVSLAMYGIKLYKEKFYFPLKSSEYYMNFTADEAGEVKLKNSGFSKETVKKANNPIVLSDFMDTWANHVNEMSTYHAFVLPIEDFSRVYNYRTPTSETSTTKSLKNTLNNAFGNGVNKYIRQMLVDINGGARSTLTSPTDKITSLAKKGAVMLSASVVIQQPSAIVRAMAYVKPKYFVNVENFKFTKHNEKWQELKKYAPVAGIKEMGYFDTGMGRSSADWITDEDYDGIREKLYAFFHDKDARKTLFDDFLGKAPAMADELSWVALWEAVKKETKKETDLDPGTEAFLERCGERFTEVVELTQVYDSVLSRSGYMRDKGSFMKMATAFMAEPTVQANMLLDAGIQGKRNGKAGLRAATGVVGAVISSIVLNTLLKSIVYAARDDEEDETQWEKYLGAVVGDLTQSLNPLTMIPFAKDIVSIFSGYDVERMDMSLVADLKDSILAIGNDDQPTIDKITGLAGSIGQFFGIPVKNVIRDVKAVINTVNSLSKGTETTKLGIEFALKDEANSTITGTLLDKVFGISFDTSNQKKYYDAVMSGDKVYAERIESLFKNPKSNIVESLKKYDPRILKAAQAEIDGKPNDRYKIAKEIVADGFKQDHVILAIQGTVSNLTKEEKDSKNKKYSLSTIDNYFTSAQSGDVSTANTHKEAIIEADMYNNGKTHEEAEERFFNSFNNTVKEEIENETISTEEATKLLEQFGNLDPESAQEKAQYYAFKRDYPDVDHNWSEKTVTKYYEVAEPADISVEIYDEYLVGIANCKGTDANKDGKADSGTVKKEKLELIDSLALSDYQKDVLYRMNGWSEKTIHQAPWH